MLLDPDDIKAIINTAMGIYEQSMSPTEAANATQTFLYGGVKGTAYQTSDIASSLWGQASSEFASSLTGNVTVVGVTAQANTISTFAVVELPVILSSPNVTSVNGIAVSQLQSAGSNAFNMIMDSFTNLANNGLYVSSADSTVAVLSQEGLQSLGYSGAGAQTASQLSAQGFSQFAANTAEATAADILADAGVDAVKFLGGSLGVRLSIS